MSDEQWVTLADGRRILLSQRAERAKQSYNPLTKGKMDVALKAESTVASAIGGKNLGDNEAFDVTLGNHAVEVKAIVAGKNPKITMHPSSRARKIDHAESNGLKAHTVVVDKRGGKAVYYYKSGVGSFRLGSMTKTSLGGLKKLIQQ